MGSREWTRGGGETTYTHYLNSQSTINTLSNISLIDPAAEIGTRVTVDGDGWAIPLRSPLR
jgi:hypothetical protein